MYIYIRYVIYVIYALDICGTTEKKRMIAISKLADVTGWVKSWTMYVNMYVCIYQCIRYVVYDFWEHNMG